MKINHKIIELICRQYELGVPKQPLQCLEGGLSHHCFLLRTEHASLTSQASWVIKLLNASRMRSVQVQKNMLLSEAIARQAATNMRAIPALADTQGQVLCQIEDHWFMVYPYIQGRVLLQKDISHTHVRHMAEQLAKLHQAALSLPLAPTVEEMKLDDLASLAEQVSEKHHALAPLIHQQWACIHETAMACQGYQQNLQSNTLISHRDLNSKNVLWDNEQQAHIIDWESAGFINRTKDVLVTAIYWSFAESYHIDLAKLTTFIGQYEAMFSEVPRSEIRAGLYGMAADWLGWLRYSFQRIIENTLDTEEYQLGCTEARNTLLVLETLVNQFERIEGIVNE